MLQRITWNRIGRTLGVSVGARKPIRSRISTFLPLLFFFCAAFFYFFFFFLRARDLNVYLPEFTLPSRCHSKLPTSFAVLVNKMAAAKSVNGREAHEETTPLLSNGSRTGTGAGSASGTAEAPANGKPAAATTDRWQHIATPEMRLMMAAFLITVGLCFTQVPYV